MAVKAFHRTGRHNGPVDHFPVPTEVDRVLLPVYEAVLQSTNNSALPLYALYVLLCSRLLQALLSYRYSLVL